MLGDRVSVTRSVSGASGSSGPQPTATRTISLESSRGGALLAVPIVVRN